MYNGSADRLLIRRLIRVNAPGAVRVPEPRLNAGSETFTVEVGWRDACGSGSSEQRLAPKRCDGVLGEFEEKDLADEGGFI